jgi:hypothetical protein
MGLIVWGTYVALDNALGRAGLVEQTVAVLVPVTMGVASYIGFALLLRVQELEHVTGLVLNRIRRR